MKPAKKRKIHVYLNLQHGATLHLFSFPNQKPGRAQRHDPPINQLSAKSQLTSMKPHRQSLTSHTEIHCIEELQVVPMQFKVIFIAVKFTNLF